MSYSISRKTLEIVKLATMEAKELECKRITVDLIAKFFFRDENVKRIVLKYYSAKELTNIIEQLDSFISKKERIPSELIDKMKDLHQEIGMPGYSSGSLNLFQDANRIATQYDKIERIFLHSLFLALIRDDSGESYPLTIFKGREGQSIYDELRQIESDELQNIEEESEFDEDEEWQKYTTDLLKEAKTYDKPFIGREDLIETMLRILARKEKSNPVCIGEPGVGKTAIVYGLAKRILNGDVPDKLKNAKFYSVDMAGMIAGTRFRGEFEERLKMVLNHMEQEENVILFFDEIHTLVGAGSAGGSAMDASNILKPYLTNRKIKFIGATTNEEYRTYIEKDNALARRFQKVMIEEPSVEDAIKILMGLKPAYEKYHNVTYRKKAIESAVKLSAKYIQDRFLPDKAIDIMDDAGAEFSIHPEKGKVITEKDIEDVMSRLYKNIRIEAEDKEMKQLKSLDKSLKSVVFGQDNAVSEIVQAIKISKTGLGDTEKPIGSFLFVGPSGVGKTELAKQLAKEMHLDFVRFDMSEYQEAHSVSKLIGSPAGYVGYEDAGILTETIKKKPQCVLLLDEIEKAHEDIYKTFLQIMDYGMLTDNHGKKVDFRNTIIIMTSNAGAHTVSKNPIGIVTDKRAVLQTKENEMMKAVERVFSPEFRNRLTKIVVFNEIDEKIGELVVKKELKELSSKLKKKHIDAKYSEKAVKELVHLGVSSEYGARGLQRIINEKIRQLFVDAIIDGKSLDKVEVDYKNGNFYLKNKPTTPKMSEFQKKTTTHRTETVENLV